MQHNNTNNTKIWPLSNNITVPKLYPFIQFIQPLGLPKCSYWRPESGLVDKEQACKMLQRNLQPGSFMAVKIFMERFYPRPRVTLLVQLIFSKLTFSTNLKNKKPTNTHFLFGWNWSGKDFCICGCQVRCAPLLCSSCQVNPSPAFPLLSLLAPQPKRGEPGSSSIGAFLQVCGEAVVVTNLLKISLFSQMFAIRTLTLIEERHGRTRWVIQRQRHGTSHFWSWVVQSPGLPGRRGFNQKKLYIIDIVLIRFADSLAFASSPTHFQ